MLCTDCKFFSMTWSTMQEHYKRDHPSVKNPGGLFTKEARAK